MCSQIGMSAPSNTVWTGRCAGARVVDVVRVDAYQRRARRRQMASRSLGQERVFREVPVRPPVRRPPGVDQHRLARKVVSREGVGVDRNSRLERATNDEAVEIGQLLESKV